LFNLVQGFQRRRFKCESLRRTTSGGKSSHGLWSGELKSNTKKKKKKYKQYKTKQTNQPKTVQEKAV
jgi:hypothetical protein